MANATGTPRVLYGLRNGKRMCRLRGSDVSQSHASRSFSSQRLEALPLPRVLAPSSPLGSLKSLSRLHGSSSFSSLSLHRKLSDPSDYEDVELDSAMPSSLEEVHPNSSWAVSFLASQFPPLDFPPDLAKRILTHSSYRKGAQTYGHNTRLAFMGRRVMNAYFLMFLQSSLPESTAGPNFDGSMAAVGDTPYVDFEELTENVLDSRPLGRYVGETWGIGDVMRWTSAKNGLATNAAAIKAGRRKVQGTAVEATIGGIFHQFGGVVAYIAFHTRVLPNLISILPQSLHEQVEDACYKLGGRNAPLRSDPSNPPISPRRTLLAHIEPKQPLRRAAI